jgi:hypothetical protein
MKSNFILRLLVCLCEELQTHWQLRQQIRVLDRKKMSFIVERIGPDYLFTKSNESSLRFMLSTLIQEWLIQQFGCVLNLTVFTAMAKQRNENHPEVVEYSDEIGKSNKWGAESHPRHLLLTRRWIYLFRTHLVEMVMPKDMPVPGACTACVETCLPGITYFVVRKL